MNGASVSQAVLEELSIDKVYSKEGCRRCSWSVDAYRLLRQRLGDQLPVGDLKVEMSRRLEKLDPSSKIAWRLANWMTSPSHLSDEDHQWKIIEVIREIGCNTDNPHVSGYIMHGLLNRSPSFGTMFSPMICVRIGCFNKEARALLEELVQCPGVVWTSQKDRTMLEDLRDGCFPDLPCSKRRAK